MNVDGDSDGESSVSSENQILERVLDAQEEIENYVDESTDEASVPTENTYDLTLSATHSYLGHDLWELRGRTILDDGIYTNLPLIAEQCVVLFPGQTLPMTVFGTQAINVMRTCIQNNRTFGVVCLDYDKTITIGTTAEIYEYMDGGLVEGFRLKAKGRQRFKVLQVTSKVYHKRSAKIKVLPEITLGPPFLDERLASLNRLRICAKNEEDLKKQERVENLDAMVTAWPAWVYRQYDPLRLSLNIRKHLRFLENRGSCIPEDPTELSYWVAQNLILDNNKRIVLLNYDCAISRLQCEMKYLMKDTKFFCRTCDSYIAKRSHMFPMNKEGIQGAYCNAVGVIHQTITFYHAEGLQLNGYPSAQYTWFPGYAWTKASCSNCHCHKGWKFTAMKSDLQLRVFWGLTRSSLKNK